MASNTQKSSRAATRASKEAVLDNTLPLQSAGLANKLRLFSFDLTVNPNRFPSP